MKTDKKAELLGEIENTESVGDINLDVLKHQENPNSVISAFCSNCKSYHELDYLAAENIFLALNQSISFENKYLIFGSCSFCKGDDLTVEIKEF